MFCVQQYMKGLAEMWKIMPEEDKEVSVHVIIESSLLLHWGQYSVVGNDVNIGRLLGNCMWSIKSCRYQCQNVQPVWQPAVYTMQLVVKRIWQPVVSCIQTFNRLSNRFNIRLYRVNGAWKSRQLFEIFPYRVPWKMWCISASYSSCAYKWIRNERTFGLQL